MSRYHDIREQQAALQLEIERLDRELLIIQEECHRTHPHPMDRQDVFVDKTYWNHICQKCTETWCNKPERKNQYAITDQKLIY